MNFDISATPEIVFGAGKIDTLPDRVLSYGRRVLLITGKRSFINGAHYPALLNRFDQLSIEWKEGSVEDEPTPDSVDDLKNAFFHFNPDVIVAIGGGSVIDAGKAVSAMLTVSGSIRDYLEGVGDKIHCGTKIPFIAVPTTAGTGSECTKNAVISETGPAGFKKSLRHKNFVPNHALIDPALTLECPPCITASSGMDAFTQLLEPFLSDLANPFTDALALRGLEQVSMHLTRSFYHGDDLQARTDMSLAACLSGICLANAGLGLVHGFASSIGGLYPIAHGLVCSTMMYPVNKITVEKMRAISPTSTAMSKYARVGKIFAGDLGKSDEWYIDYLIEAIQIMQNEFRIPRLSDYKINKDDFEAIIVKTANRNHPIAMQKEEMFQILEMAF